MELQDISGSGYGGDKAMITVSLKDLLKMMDSYTPELITSCTESISIESVKYLEYDQTVFHPSCLYIGKLSHLPCPLPESHTINAVCILDCPLKDPSDYGPNINLYILSTDADSAHVFNHIQDTLSGDYLSEKLFFSLIKDRGLQSIMDIGFEMIGRPIYLVDSSFKLIALTGEASSDDPLWTELVSQGYFSYKSVLMFQALKSIEKVNTSKKTVIMDRYSDYNPVAITAVFINRQLAANLVAIGSDKPFSQNELEAFSLLKDVISTELQKNKQLRSHKGFMYETFINDILEGKITKSDVIEERAKYLNLNLKENLYLISIFAKHDDASNSPIFYLGDLFERAVGGSRSIIYNDHIVLLVSVNRDCPVPEADLDNLTRLLKENGLYAGISSRFTQISELRWQYILATKSVELGIHMNDNKVLFSYEDYTIYHIGDICSMNHDLRSFCHPAVLTLDEYDRVNGTSYLQSLYYHLIHKKQLHTSNALHIHRNTLNYRMEKITRLVDIDWNNSETFIHLCVSFKFLELIKGKKF